MTKANDLASLLDANGDVVSSALDNVPANPTLTSLGIPNHDDITVDGSGNLNVTGNVTANDLIVDDDTATITIKAFQPKFILDDDSAAGAGSDKLIIQSAAGQSDGDYEFVLNNDQTSSADRTAMKINGNGDISFYNTSGNAKFFWDASAERLGIGTSSPTGTLDVDGELDAGNLTDALTHRFDSLNGSVAYFTSGGTVGGGIVLGDSNSTANANRIRGEGNELTFDTNSTERLRIDSSGRVGINTDAPVGILDARASATSRVHINSIGDLIVSSSSGGNLLQLIHSGATSETDASPYVEFLYASSLGGSTTRLGYFGYGSGSNSDLYFVNNAPNSSIRFFTNSNQAMHLHPDGEVTTTDQPAFRVGKSGLQTLNVGTSTLITWEDEIFDVGGNFDFAANRFEAPVAGKYFLHVTTRVDAVDTSSSYYRVSVRTSNRSAYYIIDPNFAADLNYLSLQISGVFDMDANDSAYVYVTQVSGTASHVDASNSYTAFSGYLLG